MVAASVVHLWLRGCDSTVIETATPGGHLSPGAHVTDPFRARGNSSFTLLFSINLGCLLIGQYATVSCEVNWVIVVDCENY